MKNNQLTGMLVGLLFLSTLASAYLVFQFNASVQKIRQTEPGMVKINQGMSLMQAMVNDTMEYNKTAKNPDMTRILQSVTPANAGKTGAK